MPGWWGVSLAGRDITNAETGEKRKIKHDVR